MKLSKLVIRNFRCCKYIAIEVGSVHALVGANNAGKSTILHALDFFFNPSVTKLSDESFWRKDTTLEIRVEAMFTGLDEQEKAAFSAQLRPNGSFQLARSAMYKTDAEEDGEAKIVIGQQYYKPVPKQPWLNPAKINAAAMKEWKKNLAGLIANGASFAEFVNVKTSVDEWKAAAEAFTPKLSKDDFEECWNDNPKGFAGVLKGNLPQFELIPAVREAADESKVQKTNPFGRLIHEILRTLEDNIKTDIATRLKETTKKLNREGEAERLAGITKVENTLNEHLREMMPADLEIEFQSPTLEVLLTTPKIHVDDGFKGSIDGKGHGLQRAVIFSILRSYAKLVTTKNDEGKRTLILGIEEPELYMHPTAQRLIRRLFRTMADGGDQILFSTHSPLLVDVSYFDEIIRVEQADKTDENGARIFQLTMNAMIEDIETRHPKLKGKVTAGSIRERYGHAYTPTRNEGFFARKIILVEGPTELYCLPIYGEALKEEFDAKGIAVIECGGKNQIDRLYRVFHELGIPCYVLFDYDTKNQDANTLKASRDLMDFLGHAPTPPGEVIVTEHFACFVQTWENDLDQEIPEHTKLKAAAKEFLGDCGKPLRARFIASRLTSGEEVFVPPTLKKIIDSAVKVTRRASCLKKPGDVEVKEKPVAQAEEPNPSVTADVAVEDISTGDSLEIDAPAPKEPKRRR